MKAHAHFPQERGLGQQATCQVHCIFNAGSDCASCSQAATGSIVAVLACGKEAACVVQEKRRGNSTLRLRRGHSEHRHTAPQRVCSSAVRPVYESVQKKVAPRFGDELLIVRYFRGDDVPISQGVLALEIHTGVIFNNASSTFQRESGCPAL